MKSNINFNAPFVGLIWKPGLISCVRNPKISWKYIREAGMLRWLLLLIRPHYKCKEMLPPHFYMELQCTKYILVTTISYAMQQRWLGKNSLARFSLKLFFMIARMLCLPRNQQLIKMFSAVVVELPLFRKLSQMTPTGQGTASW